MKESGRYTIGRTGAKQDAGATSGHPALPNDRPMPGMIGAPCSGIGFVNFGDIDVLTIDAAIETHGDGAIGVQLSKPFCTSAKPMLVGQSGVPIDR